MRDQAAAAFALFVSCVEGSPVTRFGTKVLIGADRDPKVRKKILYRPKEIVAIPVDEARLYGREYARLINDGELVEHTAEKWLAQQQHINEVGAPREKLHSKADDPPDEQQTAKVLPHADHESGSELG